MTSTTDWSHRLSGREPTPPERPRGAGDPPLGGILVKVGVEREPEWQGEDDEGDKVFDGVEGQGWPFVRFVRSFAKFGAELLLPGAPRTPNLIRFDRSHLSRDVRTTILEVLANGRSLIRGEHPSRVLGLSLAREVRAKVRTNQLAADPKLTCELLGSNGLCLIRHDPSIGDVRSFACKEFVNVRSFVATIIRSNDWHVQSLARPIIDHPPFHPRVGGIDFGVGIWENEVRTDLNHVVRLRPPSG